MKSVFISYGSPDTAMARKLNAALNRLGVNTFFFEQHAVPGKKIHRIMRDAANKYDCVVLICSENSLKRQGVLSEIEEVLQREAREGGSSRLIPIRLDDYVLTEWAPSYPGIAQSIRDRVVADFRDSLADDDRFNQGLAQLSIALTEVGDVLPEIENLYGSHEIVILDADGHRARQTYTRTFVPRSASVTRLMIRDLTASGQFVPVTTNIGRLEEPVDEGGKKTIFTAMDEPLPIDKPMTHVVEFLATDCYCNPRESFAMTVNSYYPLLECRIFFPQERPANSAKVTRVHRGNPVLWPGPTLGTDRCSMFFAVREPLLGCLFVLEWNW